MILLVLLAAAAIRIHGVAFGLPALNDPDEPLFMMTALDMLRSGNPNPGWFGHPATLTFYAIALVMVAVAAAGIATGRFANTDAFVAAAYADPSLLFLPARLFFVGCGLLCVWLTWRLGRRLGGARLGLIAAAFLAVNSLHVAYSQLIRTDVQMTVFALLATLAALDIAERARLRDSALAGIFLGLGVATKWPAALFALSPLAAAFGVSRGRAMQRIILLGGMAAATLFLVSPFLLFDYPALVRNLTDEARPVHPGATGGGFLANLGWYLSGPLRDAFGIAGLAVITIGLLLALRDRRSRIAVAPGPVGLAFVTCAQSLVWERWLVPLLPFLCLAAAAAVCKLADLPRARLGRPLAVLEPAATGLLLFPMILATIASQSERADDTRQAAGGWVRAYVSPEASILVEHAAFDLLQDGWRLRFPLGSAGCVDAAALLAGKIRHSKVETLRAGRAVVDIGHVEPRLLASCRADYALFTHYETYRADPLNFGQELEVYRRLLRGGRIRAVFRPSPGVRGGPIVHVVELGAAAS